MLEDGQTKIDQPSGDRAARLRGEKEIDIAQENQSDVRFVVDEELVMHARHRPPLTQILLLVEFSPVPDQSVLDPVRRGVAAQRNHSFHRLNRRGLEETFAPVEEHSQVFGERFAVMRRRFDG